MYIPFIEVVWYVVRTMVDSGSSNELHCLYYRIYYECHWGVHNAVMHSDSNEDCKTYMKELGIHEVSTLLICKAISRMMLF